VFVEKTSGGVLGFLVLEFRQWWLRAGRWPRGRLETMGRNDAFNGWALMLLISVAWCYYSFWVLVHPSRLLAAAVGISCLQLFGTHDSGARPLCYQREGRSYAESAHADFMMLCRCFRLSTATTRERPSRKPTEHAPPCPGDEPAWRFLA